jgi:hypothetical protein
MGLFDRLRGKDKPLDAEDFEALMAEMTRLGVVIITRDNGTYTVYWARREDDPLLLQTTVDALKRSVEGRGATALEAILDCREQARKQHTGTDAGGVVVAKTVVKTTTTTQTETRTEVPEGSTIKVEVQAPKPATEQTPPPPPSKPDSG